MRLGDAMREGRADPGRLLPSPSSFNLVRRTSSFLQSSWAEAGLEGVHVHPNMPTSQLFLNRCETLMAPVRVGPVPRGLFDSIHMLPQGSCCPIL